MRRTDLIKRPMRCTCFKCLSMFTEGSGPETPKWEKDKYTDNAMYVCPGCRHVTTMHEWIMLDTLEDEARQYLKILSLASETDLMKLMEITFIDDMGLAELYQTSERMVEGIREKNRHALGRHSGWDIDKAKELLRKQGVNKV